MAAPQLRLEVSLNLTGFRSEIQKLTNIAQSEFAPKINVKFNRRTLDTELNNLQAAIKRRTYRVDIGGNIDQLPDKIKSLKEQLSSLESFKIDLGVGAVKSLSKRDANKIKSDLRAEILGTQKKIYVPVSIRPSIARQDVRDFKNAVQSQLTGLSVKVKADLEAASISGGAKSRSDIDADVRRKLQEISEIGAQRMAGGGGGVTEAARREQLRRSLATGGFDIGGLKDIGKQLGVGGVGRFKNVNNLINKIVTESSIEMVKKYLDPQAVMRNSDRSGLSKVLDTFARGVFNMLGMDPASIRAQQQASRQKAFTPAGLLPEYTSRGAREEIMRRLGGADGGRDGKLALSNEAMGQRIGAILQEYFKVAEVQVRESFDPKELKQSLNVFSYIVQSLQDAETRTKQSRVDESVDSLMNTISQSLKIAEATARIRLAQVRELPQRPSQGMLPGTRIAGLLSPESAGRYRGGGAVETREELFARREREARMRSALRGLSVSSERGLELPGTTFMGDDFTRGGGRDRVTGSGRPPQRGGAIVPYAPSSKLLSNEKYSEGLRLAAAATDSFRASQIPFLGGLKDIASEFGEATKQVLLYGTAYKGLAFVTSLPGQILNAAKSQQQFSNAMQVATQTSGSYAKELLFVNNVQRAFGLDLETTRSGFTRLYASMSPAGFDSGSIEKLFVGISSAMAALQLTPDKAERVIYAFGQMASKGQVMSEELKGQLGDVLPGALAIFASAAGKSIKEFNKEIEDGVYSGTKFRDLMSKVTEELITRFGSGASAAGRSLQGLINVVKGDFTRTLESLAPLANSAAEAILKPLGGALRQLSTATKLATGERGRLSGQVTKQEQVVQELGSVAAAERGGPNEAKSLEQYKGAKQSLAALNIELENLNELAKDPAVAQQAEDIKAFTDEIGKAATFVKNFATAIGGVLSPVLNFLGTNLTTVVATVATLVFTFQGARLGLLAFAGVMTVIKGVVAGIGLLALVRQVGSLSAALATSGTIGKTVAAIYTSLGIGARAGASGIVLATGATISFRTAIIALMSATGLGLLIALIGTVGAAFLAMGDNAKQAAEDAKQAAKDMAEAARMGNVPQVEAGLRQASADAQLIEDAQNIVRQRSTKKQGIYGAAATPTLSEGDLSEAEKNTLAAAGISLPKRGAARRELLKQLNDLLAEKRSILQKGKSQLQIAEKQAERTGQAIPDLGLQGTGKPEDPNTEKTAQRSKALLDAIDQREESIADARRQREETIAQIRGNAVEGVAQIERQLADQRQKIEREIAQIQRRSADETADIERRIRVAQGEDRGLVDAEQKIADIAREGRDSRLALSERIADEEKEQARSIAEFQKKIAKELQEADRAHTKKMGDIQRDYARQVAKLIEDGTSRAAKRMTTAAQLFSTLIQRANAFSPTTGALYPSPVSSTGTTPEYANPNEVPGTVQKLDRQILELQDRLSRQSVSKNGLGLGDQFAKLLSNEGGYEDVAGLKPLPIQKMYQQIGRPFTQLYQQIQRQLTLPLPPNRREVEKVLNPDPKRTQAVLKRAERVETVRQTWNPLEAESRSRLNQTNPTPRSQPSQASLTALEGVVHDLSRRVFKRLNDMPASIYGILGDLSDYLEEGEREVLRKGIAEQLQRGASPSQLPIGGNRNTGRGNLQKAVKDIAAELLGNEKINPRGSAPTRPLTPLGGDSEWLQRFMEQPSIVPGVQNRIEGAFLPGGSFDVSKVATDFGTIAAASILRGVLDVNIPSGAVKPAVLAQVQSIPSTPYRTGDRVGYGPESQRLYGPNGAVQNTQARQTLQQTGEAASRGAEVNKLREAFASVTADSATYTNDLQKQIDLIREQARFINAGVRQSIAQELAPLNLRREKEIAEAKKVTAAAVREGLETEEQGKSLLEAKLLDIEKYYKANVAITFELEKQRNALEVMGESPLVIMSDALRETQKNLGALTNSGNIAVGIASSVGESFGSAFKGIVTGSMSARDALAGFFQGVADSFADMVANMIAEYLKMALIKGIMSLIPGLGSFGGGAAVGQAVSMPTGVGIGAGGGILQNSAAQGFGTFGPNFGIRQFANGGIVTGPTLGLVGEGRYNEAVIPLPDGKSVPVQLSGGDGGNQMNTNITVNVSNGQAQSNATGSNSSELGRKIEGAVKQVIVGELRPGGLLASR